MSAQAKTLQYHNNLPSFSEEAERGVLGAVISDPQQYYPISAFLRSEMFYLLRSRTVWDAIERCMQRGGDFDLTILSEDIKAVSARDYDDIGGVFELMQLSANAPLSYHADIYGRIVEACHIRRELHKAADAIKAFADDESAALKEVIADSQSALMSAAAGGVKRQDADMHDIMIAVGDDLEKAYNAHVRNEKYVTGVPTGFKNLDTLLGGMGYGDLLTLAACTGVGKSALISSMLLLLRQIQVPDERYPDQLRYLRVGGFTMEMDRRQYGQRMLSAYTGINSVKIRRGQLSAAEYGALVTAQGVLGDRNRLLIDHSTAPTPEYIHNKCHEWMIQGPLDFVFVDYLQHMTVSPSQAKEPRPRQVGYSAEMMKNLARELNIPVLQAAQLNRDVEQRSDKRPILSDLKESSQIEQESDVVIFIYRDSLYNEASEHPNLAELIVAKHRNGPTGIVDLYFNKACVRFENGETRRVNLSDL